MQEFINSFSLIREAHPFLIIILIYVTSTSVLSNNYIYSVLFLIISFLDSAFILFLFDIEFLALLFIMVYVGAVAVLFLFVIMMVETKQNDILNLNSYFKSFIFFIFFILFFELIYLFFVNSFFNMNDNYAVYHSFFNIKTNSFDDLSNVSYIGKLLFNYYFIVVLISGFILLMALIGAVSLT